MTIDKTQSLLSSSTTENDDALDRATDKLIAIFEEHAATLSPEEAEKFWQDFHEEAKKWRVNADASEHPSKPQ